VITNSPTNLTSLQFTKYTIITKHNYSPST